MAIVLLCCSNTFMTTAWYLHLKFKSWPIYQAIFISWGIALAEYAFQVPANRVGHNSEGGPFSAPQLKVIQEFISLVAFAIFSTVILKERLRWADAGAFLLILGGVLISLLTKTHTSDTAPTPDPSQAMHRRLMEKASWHMAQPVPGIPFHKLAFRRSQQLVAEHLEVPRVTVQRHSLPMVPLQSGADPAILLRENQDLENQQQDKLQQEQERAEQKTAALAEDIMVSKLSKGTMTMQSDSPETPTGVQAWPGGGLAAAAPGQGARRVTVRPVSRAGSIDEAGSRHADHANRLHLPPATAAAAAGEVELQQPVAVEVVPHVVPAGPGGAQSVSGAEAADAAAHPTEGKQSARGKEKQQ